MVVLFACVVWGHLNKEIRKHMGMCLNTVSFLGQAIYLLLNSWNSEEFKLFFCQQTDAHGLVILRIDVDELRR